VYPPRPDGYHPLASVFQTVSLADRLTVSVESSGFELTCHNAPLSLEDNILFRIYESLSPQISVGLRVELEKNIPMAAGLGGASSDAAQFLVALNELLSWGLSVPSLQKLALGFGADIPFFIQGGRAYVTGIGEQIDPLPIESQCFYVLVYPGFKSLTPVVYHTFDRLGLGAHQEFALGENDLELAAFAAYPYLSEVKSTLLEAGLPNVCMSGSGSTFFSVFGSLERAQSWQIQLSARHPNWQVFCVSDVVS
jgi:4-diphosphocytidyl-2-C-methyl-D-erythritol kinase